MLKGLIGLLILCLECVICFSRFFSGGIVSIGCIVCWESFFLRLLDV
ncbi:unnamed protein product [Brassica rapa subsp. narinosa]